MMSTITGQSAMIGRNAANDVMFGTGRGPALAASSAGGNSGNSGKPKKKSQTSVPYPSDYSHLLAAKQQPSLAADSKSSTRTPVKSEKSEIQSKSNLTPSQRRQMMASSASSPLIHPPAILPAREVNSTNEFKAVEAGAGAPSPARSAASSQSSSSVFSSASTSTSSSFAPPVIPGPAAAPKNSRGYSHQRRDGPTQMLDPSTLPSNSRSAVPLPGSSKPSPLKSSPFKNFASPAAASSSVLGPAARNLPGRKLFEAEEMEISRAKMLAEDAANEDAANLALEEAASAKDLESRRELESREKLERAKVEYQANKRVREAEKRKRESEGGGEFPTYPIGMGTAKGRFGPRGPAGRGPAGRGPAGRGGGRGGGSNLNGRGGGRGGRGGNGKPPPPPGRPSQSSNRAAPSAASSRPTLPVRVLSSRRDPSQKPEEMLNDGWWRFTDPATSFEYFWNEATHESQYERPVSFSTVGGDAFATARTRQAKEKRFGEHGNEGWQRFVDEETRMQYFYNESTEEGQWERPANFETIRGGMTAAVMSGRREEYQEAVESLNGGWYK